MYRKLEQVNEDNAVWYNFYASFVLLLSDKTTEISITLPKTWKACDS